MTRLPIILLIVLSLVFAGCFGEAEDEDLLNKETELAGYDIEVVGPDGRLETRHVASSPYKADTDSDGLDDFVERGEKTDPREADTDDDGLLDGWNVILDKDHPCVERWTKKGIVATNLENGRIEFMGERGTQTASRGGDPRDADTDDDGILDGEEVGGFLIERDGVSIVVKTLPHREDTDGDGLQDGFERDYGTHPTERDTDGDGVSDNGDLDPLHDLRLRLVVQGLTITTDPEGRSSREVWVDAQFPGIHYESDVITARAGEEIDAAALSSGATNVDDTGGNVREGRHNVSLAATLLSTNGAGNPLLIDVFSETGNSTSLFGQLHAIDGTLTLIPPYTSTTEPWPPSATFSGPHGSFTLRLELASTA